MARRTVNNYLIIALIAVLLYSLLLYGGTVYLQEQVQAGLTESTQAQSTRVKLTPALPLGLLTGSFSTVYLNLSQTDLGPISAETIEITGEDVNVSLWSLARTGEFALDSVGEVQARLDLTEEDLNAYFDQFSLPKGLIKAQISPDLFNLHGTIPILGRVLEIDLHGRVEVRPGNILQIKPVQLVALNAEVPAALVERILAEYLVIPIDLTSLPVPLSLERVTLSEGRVSIYAQEDGSEYTAAWPGLGSSSSL